jgi:hypothetical protein
MGEFKLDRLPAPSQLDTEDHYGNRRREPRNKLQDGLKVQVSVPPVEGTIEGELFDVASGGARIVTPVALRLGTIVTFRCGSQRVYAEVRYCRAGMADYRVGLKFNDTVDEPE